MIKIHNVLFGIFFVYATIFNPFNFGGINLLVVYLIPVLLIIILASNKFASKQLLNKKNLSILAFAAYYLFSSIMNIQAFRYSSILYSLDLIICYFLYIHLIRKNINIILYKKWLVIIITIFFIALIIQQLGIILGIPNFFNRLNSTNYQIQDNFIFSLNSLSTEPSYAATIISVCLFSFLKIKSTELNFRYTFADFKSDGSIWFMYFYQLVFYRSVFGILFFTLILFHLINLRKIKNWVFLLLLFSAFMLINVDFIALNRLRLILQGFDFTKIADLSQIDHSGSIRVLPFYYYIMNFYPFNIHSYFGYGLDYGQNFLRTLIPGIEKDAPFGGLIPLLIFDSGLIGFLLLWRMILKLAVTCFFSIETLLLIFVMVNATLNTQLFWFALIVFSINRVVFSPLKIENEPNRHNLTNQAIRK